jgi:hypothetical protein
MKKVGTRHCRVLLEMHPKKSAYNDNIQFTLKRTDMTTLIKQQLTLDLEEFLKLPETKPASEFINVELLTGLKFTQTG